MSKQHFMPKADAPKLTWEKNFADKLPLYAAKYGITKPETDGIAADALYLAYWFMVLGEVVRFKEAVTAFKNELRDGVPAGATGSIEPAAPVFAVPPAAVEPGIFHRATSIANRIKKHKDYAISDGEDMGLEGPLQEQADRLYGKPVINITISAGHPVLSWKKGLFDAVYIEVDRDGAGFRFLAVITNTQYTDMASVVPPADARMSSVAATWKYRMIYLLNDEQVAQWSDEASIAVHP